MYKKNIKLIIILTTIVTIFSISLIAVIYKTKNKKWSNMSESARNIAMYNYFEKKFPKEFSSMDKNKKDKIINSFMACAVRYTYSVRSIESKGKYIDIADFCTPEDLNNQTPAFFIVNAVNKYPITIKTRKQFFNYSDFDRYAFMLTNIKMVLDENNINYDKNISPQRVYNLLYNVNAFCTNKDNISNILISLDDKRLTYLNDVQIMFRECLKIVIDKVKKEKIKK